MSMSLVLRLPRNMHLCRSPSNVPRLPSFLEMPQNPHGLLTFGKVQNPLRLPHKMTLQRPKVMLLTFWLGNVLRATMACTFSTCQLPKVLSWKCASRHNGVQILISHLARWLRTRRFSEPTFRPSGATNHFGKTRWTATFLPFRAPASSFFWLFLSSPLSSLLSPLPSLLSPLSSLLSPLSSLLSALSSLLSPLSSPLLSSALLSSALLCSSLLLTLPTSAFPYCRKFDF